jgi:hypothetical protein
MNESNNTSEITATSTPETNVLGSTENVAAPATASKGKTTPARLAMAGGDARREYTPRGTTYWAARMVLTDGVAKGRGRPAKDEKGRVAGKRTVVYVPVGMKYDVAIHGVGVAYNSHSHKATHKRIAKDSVSYVFAPKTGPNSVQPTLPKGAKVTKPGKTATKSAPKTAPKKGAKSAPKKAVKKAAVKTKKPKNVVAPVDAAPADATVVV